MLFSSEIPDTLPENRQQRKPDQKTKKGSGPTIRIMLQKPRSTSARKNTEPAGKVSRSTGSQSASHIQSNCPPEPSELVEALANPLLYQRPVLLPALQSLIHSLEVAHSCVESYAAGEFITDQPITLGLKRVSNAWTTFISPLNTLNGLPTAEGPAKGIEWTEEEEKKRKAVGLKLLALAVEKQRCISALKKLQEGYEEGSDSTRAAANERFERSLLYLIRFATMIASIEHALQVACDTVAVKMIAEGQSICKLQKGKGC